MSNWYLNRTTSSHDHTSVCTAAGDEYNQPSVIQLSECITSDQATHFPVLLGSKPYALEFALDQWTQSAGKSHDSLCFWDPTPVYLRRTSNNTNHLDGKLPCFGCLNAGVICKFPFCSVCTRFSDSNYTFSDTPRSSAVGENVHVPLSSLNGSSRCSIQNNGTQRGIVEENCPLFKEPNENRLYPCDMARYPAFNRLSNPWGSQSFGDRVSNPQRNLNVSCMQTCHYSRIVLNKKQTERLPGSQSRYNDSSKGEPNAYFAKHIESTLLDNPLYTIPNSSEETDMTGYSQISSKKKRWFSVFC